MLDVTDLANGILSNSFILEWGNWAVIKYSIRTQLPIGVCVNNVMWWLPQNTFMDVARNQLTLLYDKLTIPSKSQEEFKAYRAWVWNSWSPMHIKIIKSHHF